MTLFGPPRAGLSHAQEATLTDPEYRRDLARIETKLDQMQEAIVSLARMEERMINDPLDVRSGPVVGAVRRKTELRKHQ